jgi:hypothetical protein
MESRAFIRDAKVLIERIELFVSNSFDDAVEANDIQRDLNLIFSGTFNPHLPLAHTLFLAARDAGIRVKPDVENQLARFSYDNFAG